jgi:hypothetical protein
VKPRPRKAFAAVALLAGLSLVFFEVRRSLALGRVESWFWPLVGGLVIVLAVVEFLPGRRSDDDADSRRADGRR